MKDFLARLNDTYTTIPDRVLKNRRVLWLLFFVLTFGFGAGATKFVLDLSDESMFPKNDPMRIAFDYFRDQFGGDESIYIVYKPKDGDLFSAASLTAVRGIQEDLLNYRLHLKPGEKSGLDHMIDVTTLVNVSYLEASDDALVSRQFIGDRFPKTAQEREALRQAALNHPDYPLNYISKDGQFGAILIRTDFRARRVIKEPETTQAATASNELDLSALDITATENSVQDSSTPRPRPEFERAAVEDYSAMVEAVQAILHKPEYTNALNYYPVGVPVINELVYKTLAAQANIATGMALLIVVVALWFLFRSFAAVVWPVVIVSASALLTVATLGWLGVSMNLMINVTVLMVLVVGVGDSVHILSGYMLFRNEGEDHATALDSAYRQSGLAVFLTSFTTMIGMLSLYLVPIEMMQNFGLSAALGTFFAYLFTVFYLPLMINLWRPFSKKQEKRVAENNAKSHWVQRALLRIEPWSYRRPWLNIGIFTVIIIVFGVGITRVEINSNALNLFEAEHPMRQTYELVDTQMGGTGNLEIMIDTGVENGLKDPALLNAMESTQRYLETVFPGELLKTQSLVNIVKDSNKSLNGGKAEYYAIPQNPTVLDQTLFLFNNANPRDRRKMVSDDYRQARIQVGVVSAGSKRTVEMINQIRPKIDEIFAPLKTSNPRLDVSLTGGLTIMSQMIDYLSRSQVQGFGTALLLISIVMFFAFRSRKLGAISIVPNLFPLIVMYGLMGYLDIPLDVDALVVAPLMIGIVVDDTIHFITQYRSAYLRYQNIERAIQEAFREVGQAVVFTSLILACSFLAFAWLDHQGLKHFGQLSAVAIVSALVADLMLLPSILVVTKARVKSKNAPEKNALHTGVAQ